MLELDRIGRGKAGLVAVELVVEGGGIDRNAGVRGREVALDVEGDLEDR